jgi:hypothetical protein
MLYRLSIAAVAALVTGGVAAKAAELPTYEVMGFAITPHQFVALGPANAQEQAPAVTLTLAGMPASAHQIAVLTPRQRPTEQTASSGKPMTTALARSSRGVVIEPITTGVARSSHGVVIEQAR